MAAYPASNPCPRGANGTSRSAPARMSSPRIDSPIAGEFTASPNHGERRRPARPDSIILHYTGMPDGAGALRQLCNPASEVSAHYFVWEDGRVVQLVAEERRAWHAGKSFWKGDTDLNSASIGVEIVNCGHETLPPYPQTQIDAVIVLARDISQRWSIAPRRVLAHSDIAPGRKRDPGELFPWAKLGQAGIGRWVAPGPPGEAPMFHHGEKGPSVRALQAMLALYGYGIALSGG